MSEIEQEGPIQLFRDSLEFARYGNYRACANKSQQIVQSLEDEEGEFGCVAKYNLGTSLFLYGLANFMDDDLSDFYRDSDLGEILRVRGRDFPKIEDIKPFENGYSVLKDLEFILEGRSEPINFNGEYLEDLNYYSLMAMSFLKGEIEEAEKYSRKLLKNISRHYGYSSSESPNRDQLRSLLSMKSALHGVKAEEFLPQDKEKAMKELKNANNAYITLKRIDKGSRDLESGRIFEDSEEVILDPDELNSQDMFSDQLHLYMEIEEKLGGNVEVLIPTVGKSNENIERVLKADEFSMN